MAVVTTTDSPKALLGRKVGMTRFYLDSGKSVPVTVIQAGPCSVTQIKTSDGKDGYPAIQIAFEDIDPRRSRRPIIGHDAKAGVAPMRFHRELRLDSDAQAAEYELGQELTVQLFEEIAFVDITSTSKGKGFAGVVKRHGFAGQEASHGVERKHRSAGSIGGGGTNRGTGPKVRKGRRMAGQMGNVQVTNRNLDVVKVIPEQNLILVKGTVPGANNGLVYLRSAKRLGRQKQLILSEKQKG